MNVEDVINSMELRVADIYSAPEIAAELNRTVGPKLAATHWMEQNKPILSALRMEKVVTVITIGLIQLVGALNILIALVMMVMEKHKDIAILMSMGARHQQIRRIFMLQGRCYRRGWLDYRIDRRLHALLAGESLSVGPSRSGSLFARIRSVRAARH